MRCAGCVWVGGAPVKPRSQLSQIELISEVARLNALGLFGFPSPARPLQGRVG
jgi:hypothetical protein